jgi:hypothetical protein
VDDKRVAVIGTGTAGLQVIPPVGSDAAYLLVFQRMPSSVDVRDNHRTNLGCVGLPLVLHSRRIGCTVSALLLPCPRNTCGLPLDECCVQRPVGGSLCLVDDCE